MRIGPEPTTDRFIVVMNGDGFLFIFFNFIKFLIFKKLVSFLEMHL